MVAIISLICSAIRSLGFFPSFFAQNRTPFKNSLIFLSLARMREAIISYICSEVDAGLSCNSNMVSRTTALRLGNSLKNEATSDCEISSDNLFIISGFFTISANALLKAELGASLKSSQTMRSSFGSCAKVSLLIKGMISL